MKPRRNTYDELRQLQYGRNFGNVAAHDFEFGMDARQPEESDRRQSECRSETVFRETVLAEFRKIDARLDRLERTQQQKQTTDKGQQPSASDQSQGMTEREFREHDFRHVCDRNLQPTTTVRRHDLEHGAHTVDKLSGECKERVKAIRKAIMAPPKYDHTTSAMKAQDWLACMENYLRMGEWDESDWTRIACTYLQGQSADVCGGSA